MSGAGGPWPFGAGVAGGHAQNGQQWFSGVPGGGFPPGHEAGYGQKGQNPVRTTSGDVAVSNAPIAVAAVRAVIDPAQPSGSEHGSGDTSTGDAAPRVAKVRKPYTITKQRERWTEDEHSLFLDALKLHGRAWRKIELHVGTKSAVQIRSHAQKFFSKLQRETSRGAGGAQGGDCTGGGDLLGQNSGSAGGQTQNDAVHIPPARAKRKPIHPYPRKAPDGGGAAQISGVGDPTHGDMQNEVDASVPLLLAGAPLMTSRGGTFQMPRATRLGEHESSGAATRRAVSAGFGGVGQSTCGQRFDPTAGPEFHHPSATNPPGATHHGLNPWSVMQASLLHDQSVAMRSLVAQQQQQQQRSVPNVCNAAVLQNMAQQHMASQFFAALASIGGGNFPLQHHVAGAHAVSVEKTEVQRPAVKVTSTGGAGDGAADFVAAMLLAAAKVGDGKQAAGAPETHLLPSACGTGSAFTAFGETTVGDETQRPSAEQMAALASVLMYFPGGALAKNAGVGSVADAQDTSTVLAPQVVHLHPSKPGFETEPDALRGAEKTRGVKRNVRDGSSGDDTGDENVANRDFGLPRLSREKREGSGDGSGDDNGRYGGSGSGSGSGENGSGQSAQTKQGDESGGAHENGTSRGGFESSSQREKSPIAAQPREGQ